MRSDCEAMKAKMQRQIEGIKGQLEDIPTFDKTNAMIKAQIDDIKYPQFQNNYSKSR